MYMASNNVDRITLDLETQTNPAFLNDRLDVLCGWEIYVLR